MAESLTNQLLSDPKFRNEVSAEPLSQSRVMQGSTLGLFGAIGIVLVQITQNQFPAYDWEILGTALVTIWGTAWSIYGRVATGLRPFDLLGWFR